MEISHTVNSRVIRLSLPLRSVQTKVPDMPPKPISSRTRDVIRKNIQYRPFRFRFLSSFKRKPNYIPLRLMHIVSYFTLFCKRRLQLGGITGNPVIPPAI